MKGSNRIRLLQAKEKATVLQMEHRTEKVVGYVRVSTEEQATAGHGLDVKSKRFAASTSRKTTSSSLSFHAGVSGAKRPENRNGFQRVLELAAAGEFSILLVWKFDRLARNLLVSVTTVHEVQERHKVNLRSVTEPIDTASPMGAMIFAILARLSASRTTYGHIGQCGLNVAATSDSELMIVAFV